MNAPRIYVSLRTETRWEKFQRVVLRRKTPWWGKPKGTLTNAESVTWTSPTTQTITHISLWDAKEGGEFIGSFELPASSLRLKGGSDD